MGDWVRPHWLGLVALALLPHVIKLACYPAYPGFDDAFIHLSVADNFAHGKGWGVNAFEPVNVSSSPLFTLLLAAGSLTASSALRFGMTLSAAATSAAILVAFVVGRRTTPSARLALVTPSVFAINVHLWRWNGTVMEPTLACLALGAALGVFHWSIRGPTLRFAVFGATAGVAFLTRFELGLVLPAATLSLLLMAGAGRAAPGSLVRRCLAMALGFLPLALAWAMFASHAFGTPIPTTFLSKASSLSLTNAVTVWSILLVLGSSLGLPALLAAVLFWQIVRRRGWAAAMAALEPFLLPGLFGFLCVTFYAAAVPEFQSAARYLLPVIFALAIVVGGIIAMGLSQHGESRMHGRAVLGMLAMQAVAMLATNVVAVAPVLRGFPENYWRASREVAAFLAAEAAPGDTVFAVSDIGMLAYYSRDRYRVVNAPGLAAPSLAGLPRDAALEQSGARLVVEHYGAADSDRLPIAPARFGRIQSFPYAAPGLVTARDRYWLNVYRRDP